MALKIALVGAHGRMGKEIQKACKEEGIMITSLWGKDHFKSSVNLNSPDVIVDFSLPEGTVSAAQIARQHRIPLVTGTTGLSYQEQEIVLECSKHVPIVQASNFSIGVNVLFYLAAQAGNYIPQYFKASIKETHHIGKKDKPSGTALSLKRAFLENRAPDSGKELLIVAHREGSIIGKHALVLDSGTECLTLKHEASSRSIYAQGALHSAHAIIGKKEGLYCFLDLMLGFTKEDNKKRH